MNPLKHGTDPKSGRYGSGSGAYRSYVIGGITRAMTIDASVRGHGEGRRRNHDEAAAEELGTHPVKGNMVNMGTIPRSPSLSHIQCEDGRAHRRLMALRWGGGFVVVRGRESRLQGKESSEPVVEVLQCQEVAGEYRRMLTNAKVNIPESQCSLNPDHYMDEICSLERLEPSELPDVGSIISRIASVG
ncbi:MULTISPECIES: hypothetical protein [Acidithrix]|uniref:hypothetical protein n=1 Tax=Acidithrix TaxID=1609233 RepID=UPI001269B291|nr:MULTISPECIES: hypothetical protein [Acidithrix]